MLAVHMPACGASLLAILTSICCTRSPADWQPGEPRRHLQPDRPGGRDQRAGTCRRWGGGSHAWAAQAPDVSPSSWLGRCLLPTAAQLVSGLLSLSGFLMQGEDQKKLDVISNEVFSNCLRQCGRTGIIASEEEDQPVRAGRAVPAGHAVPAWCPGMLQNVLCRCATDVQCPEGAWMPRITPAALPPARPQVAVEETFSGEYVVVFDPLDGSSNIDAGAPVLWLLTL